MCLILFLFLFYYDKMYIINFAILIIFKLQFIGIDYIHNPVQPSPLSISKTVPPP